MAGSRVDFEETKAEETVVAAPPADPQPRPEGVEVDLIGIRGVDFVEIWHSPESPNEMIRFDTSHDGFLRFRNALLVTRDEDEQAVVKNAAKKGRYFPADPEQTRPLVCQLCSWPFYSIDAFTRHTRFSHTSGMTRK